MSSGSAATPPPFPDHCQRHADVAKPGPCGDCADARKAAQRRTITLVAPAKRCTVHDTSYINVCNGCAADEKAAS